MSRYHYNPISFPSTVRYYKDYASIPTYEFDNKNKIVHMADFTWAVMSIRYYYEQYLPMVNCTN